MLRELFNNLELHCSKWENYFDVYETYFSKFKGKSPVIVEVGICHGGSAEMWQKYFGKDATIIGIDIVDCTKYKTEGCLQIIGDQGSSSFWDNFLQKYPEIDIFIDDGSHIPAHQILTLQKVWPYIKTGGVYLCEDLHSNIWPEFNTSIKSTDTFLQYAKDLTDVLLHKHFKDPDNEEYSNLVKQYKDLSSICFHDSITVLTKDVQLPAKNIWSKPPETTRE
jgi:hypothetical protein